MCEVFRLMVMMRYYIGGACSKTRRYPLSPVSLVIVQRLLYSLQYILVHTSAYTYLQHIHTSIHIRFLHAHLPHIPSTSWLFSRHVAPMFRLVPGHLCYSFICSSNSELHLCEALIDRSSNGSEVNSPQTKL